MAEGLVGERRGGGWIEDDGDAGLGAEGQCMYDRFKRQFQLAKDHAGGTDESGVAVDGGAVHFCVGTGDNDDGVFAVFRDEDRRYA